MMSTTKTAVFPSMMMKTAQQAKKTIYKTYNITNWVETQNLKWRQALRIATQKPDRWTRTADEWNRELTVSTWAQWRAGRPAKRWKTTWLTLRKMKKRRSFKVII